MRAPPRTAPAPVQARATGRALLRWWRSPWRPPRLLEAFTPALNALATIMLVASLLAVTLGFVVYRRLTRGERRARSGMEDFAAQL